MDKNIKFAHAHRTPRPSCQAVILDEEQRVLLIRRGSRPHHGWWSLPGGAVELGEPVTTALVREVWEETGLTIAVGPLLHVYDAIDRGPDGAVVWHYVILIFVGHCTGGRLQPGGDAVAGNWVPADKLDQYQLLAPARTVIGRALASASAMPEGGVLWSG